MTPLVLALALAAAPVTRQEAALLAVAAADLRLADTARERGASVRVRLTDASARGWSFRASATRPCAPSIAVCSSLLAHLSVSRSGAVRDDDVEGSPDLRPLVDYVRRRDLCEHWRGEEGYDAARGREIARAFTRLRCGRIDAERRRLSARYADPASRRPLAPRDD